jgi:hypothetical protein
MDCVIQMVISDTRTGTGVVLSDAPGHCLSSPRHEPRAKVFFVSLLYDGITDQHTLPISFLNRTPSTDSAVSVG